MRIESAAAARTDVGRVRERNEDAYALPADFPLFLVADGMGGLPAGQTASQLVAQVLPQLIEKRLGDLPQRNNITIEAMLAGSVVDLSEQMRQRSAGVPGVSGLGTTVVLALLQGDVAHIAHMGDSRAYLYRAGSLSLLTEDHSVVGILLRSGEITEEQARKHPARSSLSRFIGMESPVPPDVQAVSLQPGDRLLLCTDGLYGMVSDGVMAECLETHPDAGPACEALITVANAGGGKDNITALVVNL